MFVARLPRFLALLALVFAASWAPHAAAQTAADRADARAVATEGVAAFDTADFDRARQLFERAEQLVHSPVHLLYLARSLEALGRLVEARETYLEITRETIDRGAPRAFRNAQQDAVVELAAVEERVPSLTISVARAGDGPVVILMNGKRLPAEVAGVRRPVDPGFYRLEALAPGRRSRVVKAQVKERQNETVRLVMRKLRKGEDDEYAAAAGLDEDDEDDRPRRRRPAAGDDEPGDEAPVGAYLALAAGGIGAIAGTLFFLKASGQEDEANALCNGPGGICPDEKRPQIDALDAEAKTNKNLAAGSFVIAGVGIALGITLLVLDGDADEPAPKRRTKPSNDEDARLVVRPVIGLGAVGVAGTF